MIFLISRRSQPILCDSLWKWSNRNNPLKTLPRPGEAQFNTERHVRSRLPNIATGPSDRGRELLSAARSAKRTACFLRQLAVKCICLRAWELTRQTAVTRTSRPVSPKASGHHERLSWPPAGCVISASSQLAPTSARQRRRLRVERTEEPAVAACQSEAPRFIVLGYGLD